MSRPLYPRELPGIHCTRGWVGSRTGLNGCGKSRPNLPPPGRTAKCPTHTVSNKFRKGNISKQLCKGIAVITQLYYTIHINMSTTCFGHFGHRQVGYNYRRKLHIIIWYSTIISVGVSRGTRSRLQKSWRAPSNSFVNQISSPSTYTNTDGYTVSPYILCSFLR